MTSSSVLLRLPVRGRWVAQNSPANRVPSHGTRLFGTTYAIDFVAVDERGKSAPHTWRSMLTTERPEGFFGFGVPILSPTAGTVVATHDGEPDHEARRSQLALIPYALSQASRVRGGVGAIAGNHVVIAQGSSGPFILLAHLQNGSVRVAVGDPVGPGLQIGSCGNSGNSTEPHVHVQATDSMSWATSRGLPIAFEGLLGGVNWLPKNAELFDVP